MRPIRPGMKTANRLPIPTPLRTRACSARWLAGAATLFCTLASPPAQAALREYHVHFQPSPTPGAAGYTLHLGTSSGVYPVEFDLGNPPPSGGTIVYAVDLEDSTDLFVSLRAYDTQGIASSYSNELRVAAIVPAPTPPPSGDGGVSDGGAAGDGAGGGGGSGSDGSGSGGESPTGDGSSGTGEAPGDDPVVDPPLLDPPLQASAWLGLSSTSLGEIWVLDRHGQERLLTIDSLASKQDLRPARCDLDGDGDHDLVIGFGEGSAGQLALLELEAGVVRNASTLVAGSAAYRKTGSGMTFPTCGDVDGDGLAELVVGFGPGMEGRIQIFDDTLTGLAPFVSPALSAQGVLEVPAAIEAGFELYPAVGDIDADGRAELVLGTGPESLVGLYLLEDAVGEFAPHPSLHWGYDSILPLRFRSPERGDLPMAYHPVLGDVDGDGDDEIVVSFGRESGGRIMILRDLSHGSLPYWRWLFPRVVGYVDAGRRYYRRIDGETRVALGDLDADGRAELIVGFKRRGKHELQVFDDPVDGMEPILGRHGFVRTAGYAHDRHLVPASSQ